MHIAEGTLSPETLVAGAILAAAGVAVGLRKMEYDRIPQVAVLSASFFVASLIHVPIGPSSAHLILNGLCGVILGWAVFPAMLVALFLQAILFGFGGITTLGVNTVVMAFPGIVCYYLFNSPIRTRSPRTAMIMGFAAGVLGIVVGALVLSTALLFSSGKFLHVVELILAAHVPVMVLEGIITGAVVAFLRKVCPELLGASLCVAAGETVHA